MYSSISCVLHEYERFLLALPGKDRNMLNNGPTYAFDNPVTHIIYA